MFIYLIWTNKQHQISKENKHSPVLNKQASETLSSIMKHVGTRASCEFIRYRSLSAAIALKTMFPVWSSPRPKRWLAYGPFTLAIFAAILAARFKSQQKSPLKLQQISPVCVFRTLSGTRILINGSQRLSAKSPAIIWKHLFFYQRFRSLA